MPGQRFFRGNQLSRGLASGKEGARMLERVWWGRLLTVFLVFAVVLVLVAPGCSRKQAPVAEPKVLRRAFSYGADPGSLDPIQANRIDQYTVMFCLFDRLVRYDPAENKIVPQLAERWEVSPDGRTYTFYLRKGAKFHNGREVEAADFKYSLERHLDPANASVQVSRYKGIVGSDEMLAGKAKEVSGIEAPDKYVLKITLKKPSSVFFESIAGHIASAVVPREEVERLGQEFGAKPVGSGPFIFESWTKDDRIVVKANRDYWAGRPKLDGVEFRIMPEAATREAEFLAGNLDYIVLTGGQYRKFSQDPKWRDLLVEVPEAFTRFVGFNCTKPPFDKKEVRQAFCYGVDRTALVHGVLMGKAYPATGVLPPSLPGFNPDLKGYTYDPEKAKQLLAQAGYPRGIEVEILCTDNPAYGLPVFEAAMEHLKAAGITLKPVVMDFNTLLTRVRQGDYQCYASSTGGTVDPLGYLGMFGSVNQEQATRYKNPEVDRLLEEANAAADWDEVLKKLREAERLIVDDAPWCCLNYNKAVLVRQPWVEGLVANPTDIDLQFMERVSLGPRTGK